jgi:Family of unknown function (DUF5906)
MLAPSPSFSKILKAEKKFFIYRLTPSTRPGKVWDKKPLYESADPANFMYAEDAERQLAALGAAHVLGYYFTEDSERFFYDLDGCRSRETGELTPIAHEAIQFFQGAYVEVSVSGTGIHIVGKYRGARPAHGSTNKALGLELYTADRGMALGTPYENTGSVDADCTAFLNYTIACYFPPDRAVSGDGGWTEGPCEGGDCPADDAELLRRAMQSKSTASAFGHRASFADLWLANESALANSYPDRGGGRAYDASAADAALAQHFAWWTRGDCARIRRLMLRPDCGLKRDKYEREDYLQRTILGAVARQTDFYGDKSTPAATPASVGLPGTGGPLPREAANNGFISLEQQISHFDGCVYIESMNRALVPGGDIMRPEAFDIRYGGFNFHMGANNDKVTDDAWKAWTKNRAYRCERAYATCFKPKLPFGEIVTRNGQRFVNTYLLLDIERKAGDASPFLNHLAKVLPNERDAKILLSYMAACVQHQGFKFQWAPLLQGVEGNGKTLFSRCVQQAVGPRYTHWAKASELGKNFNAWMTGKVFYAVEDIYVQDSKMEVMEALKPMISGAEIEIELKGVDKVTADICGNFMFNSNHQDAIRKTKNDRRFCVLFTAQQKAEDLSRDGMGPGSPYFPNLYNTWLEKEGGYAIVNELLHTYEIPAEFNPAGDCHRAPITSSTHEAIEASLGGVEQDILEAIEEEKQGFCGGWISSHYVGLLPRAEKLTSRKRHQILEGMGYVLHSVLKNGGRVDNRVMPDNNRPKLYIRRTDVTLSQISSPAEVANAYETANQFAVANSTFGRGPYGN